MQILSVFGGGLWIIPLLTLAGAAYFFIVAQKASKSGSTQQTREGIKESGNVPIYKTGQFYFSMALIAATIAVIIIMINER